MASTKVRGITIELGADTSGLSKALSGVNKEIGKTQKDLKDVERLLKMDPSNTELLAQKQKLLSDRVEETKTKLDALKQAQASIDMSTEDGQRQYDALTREIISCENELKNAEQAASSFNATSEKISVAAGKMSQKFGDLADKTKGLSMAAGGALAGLAGLAVKAGKDADELNTLSKQTGIATDELQKMQYASDLIDVDVDTITGSLKKMKKGLDSNADAFEELGVATKENGQFRDVTDIFYDTVEALSQIPNETERDIKAMEIFGKSADDIAEELGGQDALAGVGDLSFYIIGNSGFHVIAGEADAQTCLAQDTFDGGQTALLGDGAACNVQALNQHTFFTGKTHIQFPFLVKNRRYIYP